MRPNTTPVLADTWPPVIVVRALTETVCDIGQMTPDERRQLARAVKNGTLQKAKAGPYPMRKWVYGPLWADLEAQRAGAFAEYKRLAAWETAQRCTPSLAATVAP